MNRRQSHTVSRIRPYSYQKGNRVLGRPVALSEYDTLGRRWGIASGSERWY